MGGLYLESGESLVLTTDRMSVDDIVYDAMLTDRRLILIDNRHARFEPRITSLTEVRSVKSGRAATGEPVIILVLKGEGDAPGGERVIIFQQEPLENRRADRDLWLKKFIELCVSGKEQVTVASNPPTVEPAAGMRPSVRRWVAPDIVRPRPDNFPVSEPAPRLEIHEDESSILPPPAPAADSLPDRHIPAEAGVPDTAPVPENACDEVPPEKTGPEDKAMAMDQNVLESPPLMKGPEPDRDDSDSLSSSILSATRSIIAARAREELAAHPSRPGKITRTSAIPEIPAQKPAEPEPEETTENSAEDTSLPEDELPACITVTDEEPKASPALTEEVTAQEPTFTKAENDDIPADADTVADTHTPESLPKTTSGVFPEEEKPVILKKERSPEPVPPARGIGHLVVAGGILLCLILIVAAFVFLSGAPPAATGTVNALPTPLPTVPTPLSPTTTPGATLSTASSSGAGAGVWVRINYNGQFNGEAGNPGFMQKISGQGTDMIKVLYDTRPVSITAEKLDNSGQLLTIEIIRDGRTIASRSTTAPMGSVSLLIDPVTGQPPGLVTTVPTTGTGSSETGGLEYL